MHLAHTDFGTGVHECRSHRAQGDQSCIIWVDQKYHSMGHILAFVTAVNESHWQGLPAFPKSASCPTSPVAGFPGLARNPEIADSQAQWFVRRAALGFCFQFPKGGRKTHPVQEKCKLLLLLECFLLLWKMLGLHALSWAVATCLAYKSRQNRQKTSGGKKGCSFQSADNTSIFFFFPEVKSLQQKSSCLGKKIFYSFSLYAPFQYFSMCFWSFQRDV